MLEEIVPLSPVHFFALQFDCHQLKATTAEGLGKQFFLPHLDFLTHSESFADLAIAWGEKGLYFSIEVKRPLLKVMFPEFQKSDSIELFIDTRDVKTSGYNTRFCHHFYFLPEKVKTEEEEVPQAAEITRFRGEESHVLCDPSLLILSTSQKRTSYTMNIFIPSECLHGYDPTVFDRLGFTYRINCFDGKPQYFSVCGEEFSIEQQPSTWSSLKLVP